ncbi:MAG: peptidylprolyl isomerase, partial [Pyrinomonadaceae bacterium]
KGVKPEADSEAAVIETNFGDIVIELYPNLAPKMVERFKTLAREGFYNGTTFHRIDSETGVVQGGDPNSKDADPSNDGMGGSSYPDLPAEFTDVLFERGVVGAARSRDINSANAQFYITLKRVPMWDGKYTVFGRVIRGMNDADIISTAPVRVGTENPADPIVIKRVTLQPRAKF